MERHANGNHFRPGKYSQRPAHSPSCLPSGTLINGILCSEHRAMTSFLYASSSQASFRTHMCAWRRSSALEASRRPRARPSCIRASLRTPLSASRTDIWPFEPSAVTSTSSAASGALFSSTSDCKQVSEGQLGRGAKFAIIPSAGELAPRRAQLGNLQTKRAENGRTHHLDIGFSSDCRGDPRRV